MLVINKSFSKGFASFCSFGKPVDNSTELVVLGQPSSLTEQHLLKEMVGAIENSAGLPTPPIGAVSKPSGTCTSLQVSYAGGRPVPSEIREAMQRARNRYGRSWSKATWHTHIIAEEYSLRYFLSDLTCSCGHPAWSHQNMTGGCAGCHADGQWAGTSYGGHDKCKCKTFTLDYCQSFPSAQHQAKAALRLHREITYLEAVQDGSIDPCEQDREQHSRARVKLSVLLTKSAKTPYSRNKNGFPKGIVYAQEQLKYWEEKVQSHHYETSSIADTLALVKPIAKTITPAGFNFDRDTGLAINDVVVFEKAPKTEPEVVVNVRYAESLEEFMLTLGERRSFTELTMQEHFDLFQWQTKPAAKAASGKALNDCARREAEYQAQKALAQPATNEDTTELVQGMTLGQWLVAMPKPSLNTRQKALVATASSIPLLFNAAQQFLF